MLLRTILPLPEIANPGRGIAGISLNPIQNLGKEILLPVLLWVPAKPTRSFVLILSRVSLVRVFGVLNIPVDPPTMPPPGIDAM